MKFFSCLIKGSIFLFSLGLLFLIILFFNVSHVDTLLQYESLSVSDSVDAVVVLGGGTGSRVMEAVSILDRYNPRYLIMTGGPYFRTTTPQLMADYAKHLKTGLPIILYEENSYSTYDHIVNLVPLFYQYDIQSVLVVTSLFHTARSYAVFSSYVNKHGHDIDVFIHGAADGIDYSYWWKDHEMLQRVLLELLKRIYYSLFLT